MQNTFFHSFFFFFFFPNTTFYRWLKVETGAISFQSGLSSVLSSYNCIYFLKNGKGKQSGRVCLHYLAENEEMGCFVHRKVSPANLWKFNWYFIRFSTLYFCYANHSHQIQKMPLTDGIIDLNSLSIPFTYNFATLPTRVSTSYDLLWPMECGWQLPITRFYTWNLGITAPHLSEKSFSLVSTTLHTRPRRMHWELQHAANCNWVYSLQAEPLS